MTALTLDEQLTTVLDEQGTDTPVCEPQLPGCQDTAEYRCDPCRTCGAFYIACRWCANRMTMNAGLGIAHGYGLRCRQCKSEYPSIPRWHRL